MNQAGSSFDERRSRLVSDPGSTTFSQIPLGCRDAPIANLWCIFLVIPMDVESLN